MADGIEVTIYHDGGGWFGTTRLASTDEEWQAVPLDIARARERVVDTARKVMKHRYDVFTSHAALLDELFSDLADLDAAEGGAGK